MVTFRNYRAGVEGSRSALTSHRLKYKALVKIRHLFLFIIIHIYIYNIKATVLLKCFIGSVLYYMYVLSTYTR